MESLSLSDKQDLPYMVILTVLLPAVLLTIHSYSPPSAALTAVISNTLS